MYKKWLQDAIGDLTGDQSLTIIVGTKFGSHYVLVLERKAEK